MIDSLVAKVRISVDGVDGTKQDWSVPLLKKNQIYQGDCIELLSQVEPGSIDLVFADPPFNIGYEYDVYDDSKATEDYLSWCRRWIDGVYRALKPDGTFWLAIGDEYAAELKIESQKIGFSCRSWVIWYYTFGVNCKNGFSRSHTHLFHFVKDKKRFTFNRAHPRIRVPSARELVYADSRANPDGRLPDNTWITRPQDAPRFLGFAPDHDTWYFARVAGTFKEREGFHGCQMPEQLLARIIRTSSRPNELVLDPFSGSGTTVSVAKKLGRHWMGFELSEDYVFYIKERLEKTNVGDRLDGVEDPIQSAPSTANGKRRKKSEAKETELKVYEAWRQVGYSTELVLCDKEINRQYISACQTAGSPSSPYVWNRYLLSMYHDGKLSEPAHYTPPLTREQLERAVVGAEVAWRLLSIDYSKTLEDILCVPEFGEEFDRLATEFSTSEDQISSVDFRRAALWVWQHAKICREQARIFYHSLTSKKEWPESLFLNGSLSIVERPGAFLLTHEDSPIYAGASVNMRQQIELMLTNSNWSRFDPDMVKYVFLDDGLDRLMVLKSALVIRENPPLNCRLLAYCSELAAHDRSPSHQSHELC